MRAEKVRSRANIVLCYDMVADTSTLFVATDRMSNTQSLVMIASSVWPSQAPRPSATELGAHAYRLT